MACAGLGQGFEAAPFWRLADTRLALISAGNGESDGKKEGVGGGR
jgi:hypothetical protein